MHLVQARLLFLIILHARNKIQQSTTVLVQAVSLALTLGMHNRSFATDDRRQDLHKEESFCRT